MARILNQEINENKKIGYSLQKIYGIGKKTNLDICHMFNINPILKWNELSNKTQFKLITYIEKNPNMGKDLMFQKKQSLNTYMLNGSLRGFRHKRGLPVNGQRTHSNAQTVRRLKGIIKRAQKKKRKN